MIAPDRIVVEGAWAVEALLDCPHIRAQKFFAESGRHVELVERIRAAGFEVEQLSAPEIAEAAGYDFHRGIFAHAIRPIPDRDDIDRLTNATKVVAPIDLADPGNVGTIVRTAVAFGADAILVEQGRGADIYSRKCIRASATGIFRLPVFEVPSLRSVLMRLSEEGFIVFGTGGAEEAVPACEARRAPRSIVLFGTEKDGLTDLFTEVCDEIVHIPMQAGMDSLNVAVSAGIVLYELFGRQA